MFFIFSSCNKDDNGVQPTENEPTFTDNIKALQNRGDDLLTNLLAVRDTASALDSVLKVLLIDTTVVYGEVTSQGLYVKYANGIIGGILINPEDGEPLHPNSMNKVSLIPVDINSFSPTAKKTIFINPHYNDRQNQANQILNLYNTIFPKIGYNPPITLLNNAATIDAMTNLSGYGIIHIYSHGWAYPKSESITEVYLMTGEEVNAATNEKYKNELLKGNIPVIKVHENETKYFLSSLFFSSKNDFSNDSTMVYGGFCFSFRGGWPNAMIDNSKAGAYTGFSWRVETNWNSALACSIFDTLSNNSLKTPRTLDYWFTQTPTIPKQKWDPDHQLFCKIQYTGHSDLTLWSSMDVNISPNPASAKPNEIISFTAKVNNKLPSQYKYIWNFGDQTGDFSVNNDSTTNHTFTKEGTYTVAVKLYDQSNKQIATASSQAVIRSNINIPNFTSLTIDICVGTKNTVSGYGIYTLRNPVGGGIYYTGDTSFSYTETSAFMESVNLPLTISWSGNTFYGDTSGNSLIENWTISVSGSYNQADNTFSFTYSVTDERNFQTHTQEKAYSFSVNNVPNSENISSGISCDIKGEVTCNYISALSYHFADTPIPPHGVTEEGFTKINNLDSYFCSDGYVWLGYDAHFKCIMR